MYDLFVSWIGNVSFVSSDVVFIFVVVASLFVLNFLFDFFRFLFYYCLRG